MLIVLALWIGIASLILLVSLTALVVGIAKKQPKLWKGSLLSGFVSIFLFFGFGIYASVVAASTAYGLFHDILDYVGIDLGYVGSTVDNQDRPATSAQKRMWFKWSTGLELPADVRILDGTLVKQGVFNLESYYITLQAPDGFEQFLREHFEPETWKVAQEYFASLSSEEHSFWSLEDVKSKSYYSRFKREVLEETYDSVLSFDPQTGRIYFVGARGRE